MNVIWVIADTFRRDHLGCYGNQVIHTPSLDALAARSVRFDHHHIASFATMPARSDFLTGRWTASFHAGWVPLPQDLMTLPQILNQKGLNTTGVVDTPMYLRSNMNYDRGFSTFFEIPGQRWLPTTGESRDERASWRFESDRCAPRTFTKSMEWLERHYKEDFFLYIDTWDPHEPWDAPDYYTELYWPENGGEVVMPSYTETHWAKDGGEITKPDEVKVKEGHAFYCGEVTMVDTWFGHFLRCLDNMDLMENTAIIFTSDHGTYHGEHGGLFGKHPQTVLPDGTVTRGFTPGYSPLYEEVVATPLLMYVPNIPPGAYRGLTSAIDLAPTVLDILGQEIPSSMEGRSLLPAMKDSSVAGREYVISGQPFRNRASSIIWVDGQVHSMENDSSETITTAEWSLIYAVERGMSELFHLPSDPKQEKNVINEHPEVARELHQLLVNAMRDHNVSLELREPRLELRL